MRRLFLMAGLVAVVIGCSGEEGQTVASTEALCRDWCTCSGSADVQCLNSCMYSSLEDSLCARNEYRRYITCMMDRACSDPFDDCKAQRQHPSAQECFEAIDERCLAQCGGQGEKCGTTEVECYQACYWGASCERLFMCESQCGRANTWFCLTTGECKQTR